jgi:hypothetical protein
MSLLRPPKHPRWMPRYSRPPGVGPLVFLLVLVAVIMWVLGRLS